MKKPLSADQIVAITLKGAAGRKAWLAGSLAEAEAHFLEAWAVLPAPATDYDYAQSICRGMVTFYRDTRVPAKAFPWLDTMRTAYGGTWDPSVEFLAATVQLAAGEMEKAFDIFDKLHAESKTRPFQGEDPKYLAFYKSFRRQKPNQSPEPIPPEQQDSSQT